MQHLDEAVLQIETLVQQLPQAFQFGLEADLAVLAAVAAVVEAERSLGDGLDARVDLLGQFQATLVTKGPRLVHQLLVDLEMAGRDIVHQHFAEALQRLGRWHLGAVVQAGEDADEFLAFLQPAVDQLVHATPAFLGVLAALEHDDLASLTIDAVVCAETVFCRSGHVKGDGTWKRQLSDVTCGPDYAAADGPSRHPAGKFHTGV